MNEKLIYISLITEFSSFLIFLNNNSLITNILALLFHGIALFLIISVLVKLSPDRFKKSEKFKSITVFFLLIYPTLYIGYIAVIILIIYVLHRQKVAEYIPFLSFSVEEFLDESFSNKAKLRSFGEGALFSISKTESVNKTLKEKAILALSELKKPELFPLLKESLSSNIDEVRLFAFSIVSKLEKKFNENLHQLKEKLKDESISDNERAEIYYQIAKQYYDFIYYHVVDNEFRDFMLQESIYYCKLALNIKEHPVMYTLLGNLYKETGLIEIAYNYFINVSRYSTLNPADYVPPIAEIYFRFGMFKDLVELLKINTELKLLNDVNINFIMNFWLRENESSCRYK